MAKYREIAKHRVGYHLPPELAKTVRVWASRSGLTDSEYVALLLYRAMELRPGWRASEEPRLPNAIEALSA